MRAIHPLLLVLGLATFAQPALAQPNFSVLDPKTDAPRKMLATYLMKELQKHFDARRADIAKLKTPRMCANVKSCYGLA